MKPRYGIVVLALLLSLTACGDSEPTEPPDLRGQWQQVMSGDSDEPPQYYHLASISDNSIQIYYYYTADGSTNLYWYGTFVPPEDGKEPYVWESENKLPENISPRMYRYASRDKKKEFTYKKGNISYMIAPSQALRMNVTLERAEKNVEITGDVPEGERHEAGAPTPGSPKTP